jgi:hypothetical protein
MYRQPQKAMRSDELCRAAHMMMTTGALGQHRAPDHLYRDIIHASTLGSRRQVHVHSSDPTSPHHAPSDAGQTWTWGTDSMREMEMLETGKMSKTRESM